MPRRVPSSRPNSTDRVQPGEVTSLGPGRSVERGGLFFLVLTALNTGLYHNYLIRPALFVIPGLTVVALPATGVLMFLGAWGRAWIASALVIATATLFGVADLCPNLLPSTLNPAYGLTVFNSASSPLTLKLMLAVALVFAPLSSLPIRRGRTGSF